MIESFAFVIPIYPPHYHYIYDLINKNEFNGIDIFLIFSNNTDYELFEFKSRIKPIIMPENIHTHNIVTYKKFYALNHHLINMPYDGFIVCDSEISLVYENFNIHNILQKINNFFDNKLIYAGEMSEKLQIDITKSSCEMFGTENNEKLRVITGNYSLYSWWSEIPYYKRSHLQDFFNNINYSDINWYHFDHIIYINYLILFHNFNFINLTHIINHRMSLESYYTDDINNLIILKNNKYQFGWATIKLFDRFKDFFINNGTLMLYHLDR